MDGDELIGGILAIIGAAWMFAGLLLIRWLRTSCGMCPGLFAIYLLSLTAFAVASIYFYVSSYIKSGDVFGVVWFVIQITLVTLLGSVLIKPVILWLLHSE